MDDDLRYKWIEQRIVTSLQPKKEALMSLVDNEDNKLIILEFLNNEDTKKLHINYGSSNNLLASHIGTTNTSEKGMFFLKISNSKLLPDNMSECISYFEASTRLFNHLDLMTRELFMPLLCLDNSQNANSDKLMDILHRMMSQISLTQSQIEDSVSLPLPAFQVLASVASNANRKQAVLQVLETTIVNWQKQIRNLLKNEPDAYKTSKQSFYTKDEIQLWTTRINKLNNLMVQIDAAYVKDILSNLENNNSVYAQSFYLLKQEIESAIQVSETNLRYISTLTPWIYKIKTFAKIEDIQYLFLGLLQTVFLIWKHSKYYHTKEKFLHMLSFLSNEIVSISKDVVGSKILEDPQQSYIKLKDALKVCAMFRGTYLDFKEKSDVLNNKYHIAEKKINFNDKVIWWVNTYDYSSSDDHKNKQDEEIEVLKHSSPWPQRNSGCFQYLNVFMERCNDILELVQTMRHFQILSGTVSIGGADDNSMNTLAQEVHLKYECALSEFKNNVSDLMNTSYMKENFGFSFFHLRNTIKELERELSVIIKKSIQNCSTINSKLKLLEVFEGVHERDVIQDNLKTEQKWILDELINEFQCVKALCNQDLIPSGHLPTIVKQIYWFTGLEKRIRVPMEKLSSLYPNLLVGDIGWQLRDTYRQTMDSVQKCLRLCLDTWKSSISVQITEKLQQSILKSASIDEMFSKRPTSIEVNLDFELEKLLKEIHYISLQLSSNELPHEVDDMFKKLKDKNKIQLWASMLRAIAEKYNFIIKNISPEEKQLFELKLNKIDEMIDQGLKRYNWNSVEIPDFIEHAYSVICVDVYQNLEHIRLNTLEIKNLANEWSCGDLDVFKNRDTTKSSASKHLLELQTNLHAQLENKIIRDGKRIHSLLLSSFAAVGISKASPGWQEYMSFVNEIILNAFKSSTLTSLQNMFGEMIINKEQTKAPFVCVELELVENRLSFNPPLDENCHKKNLQEILFDWINMFISRGSYVDTIGDNKSGYDQMIACDESVFNLINQINVCIEKSCNDCKQIAEFISVYNFLWTVDINDSFEEFLKGNLSMSRKKTGKSQSRNFLNDGGVAKSITSLGSMLTPDMISDVERKFLSPFHSNNKIAKDFSNNTPLLEDFDSEIQIYVTARDEIKNIQNYQDIDWIRVNLEPTVQVLITLSNKWIWTFTSYLANQIKTTLIELDTFLKRMEPEIEKITGDERDTKTFMKMMRMFNEVSSMQQEMEIKFELMKKTLNLLKKYEQYEVPIIEAKFNGTPIRWTNLKFKVTQAKQRLGPTIQEESKAIIQDLKIFGDISRELLENIETSILFKRETTFDQAYITMDNFFKRYNNLQNKSEDLKQLQELLESKVVDFSILIKSKTRLYNLKQIWRLIRDLRKKHMEWSVVNWQKIDIKRVNEETDAEMTTLNNLSLELQSWDVIQGIKQDIFDIKSLLPIIEDLANPAMRTRHWKQLLRIACGNSMFDNESFKALTFGRLLGLNLQAHSEEVKGIVSKAIKDLSIEITLKTYEEIWLSKLFEFIIYHDPKNSQSKTKEDEDKSSHASQSRAGVQQPSAVASKSVKRLSIGSLPQSLAAVEPINENMPIYLISNLDNLFVEIENHQIVLEDLLKNQSAGSFYDEITKWQNMLKTVEDVLLEWNQVQIRWQRIEPIFSSNEMHTILPQESISYYKTDKDFKVLMQATRKNNNILKCCQRKNILNIIKHMNQTLDICYEALVQEMNKKRSICPMLFLLNQADLLEILCCGRNINRFGRTLSVIYSNISGLKSNVLNSDKQIIGIYGRSKEYFQLSTPISYNGIVEEMLNEISSCIKESLKDHLMTAISAKFLPVEIDSIWVYIELFLFVKKEAERNELKVLQAISENPSQQIAYSLQSWCLQHTAQTIELCIKIIFTQIIENELGNQAYDKLISLQSKISEVIKHFTNFVALFDSSINLENDQNISSLEKSMRAKGPVYGVLLKSRQHESIQLIVRLLVYYRDLMNEICEKKIRLDQYDWLVKFKYYLDDVPSKAKSVNVTVKNLSNSKEYGFDYLSASAEPYMLNSPKLDFVFSSIFGTICKQHNTLVIGNNSQDIVNSLCEQLGRHNYFFVCSHDISVESIYNISKAIVLSGIWVTFMEMDKLSNNNKSILSNVLTQLSMRNETITINNESLRNTSIHDISCFAIINDSTNVDFNVKDSLKLIEANKPFENVSYDILRKFRIVRDSCSDVSRFIGLSLIMNGFKNHSLLSDFLTQIVCIFTKIQKFGSNFASANGVRISKTILVNIIRDASVASINGKLENASQTTNTTLTKEKVALASSFLNYVFSRVDHKTYEQFTRFIRKLWVDVELPLFRQIMNKIEDVNILVGEHNASQIEAKINTNDPVDAVIIAMQKLNFAPSILLQSKSVNIIEGLKTYKNVMIVGQSGYGKTTCFKIAMSAMQEMGIQLNLKHLYINCLSDDEIFGQSNCKRSKESIMYNLILDFTKNAQDTNVLYINGERESNDTYLFESLLKNDVFLGRNSEKLTLNSKLNIMWETNEVSNYSPSILSMSHMIFFEMPLFEWRYFIKTAFSHYPDTSLNEKLRVTLETYVHSICIDFKNNQMLLDDIIPVTFESKVRFMLTFLKSMIKTSDLWDENDINSIVEYSIVSTFSAAMRASSKKGFNELWRQNWSTYPKDLTIFDYYYDIDSHQFLLWSDAIPTFSCAPHQGIPHNVFVHTSSTVALSNLIDITMAADESILVVGQTGCGKTLLIEDKLRASCSGDINELFYIAIKTNRLTDSSYIQSRINNHLQWKHGSLYVPKGNKRMFCFIDDIHLAKMDFKNRQSAVEFLNQHLDCEYFFDYANRRWQHVKNITYMATYNSNMYTSSKSNTNRLFKHFHTISLNNPTGEEIEGIYTKLLHKHFFGDNESENITKDTKAMLLSMKRVKELEECLKGVVRSSIELNNKMGTIYLNKSDRVHYLFTLQTLTTLFRHLCISLAPDSNKDQLLTLWNHECEWTFGHKLINRVDFQRFKQTQRIVIKKNFSDAHDLSLLNSKHTFSNLRETESGIVLCATNPQLFQKDSITDGYEPIEDSNHLKCLIQTSLNEYNKEQQKITFPLYNSTIKLISRLCHTIPGLGGNVCIVSDSGLSNFVIQLVSTLIGFTMVTFKISKVLYGKDMFFQQLKTKLISAYYRAGIRGEKVLLCLTEEEMVHRDFVVYVAEFIVSEEILHLFTIEEETTILNSIRTQVVQTGLVYSKEIAWDLFMKNIRENIRIIVLINDSCCNFQSLNVEHPSFFNSLELIWLQNWDVNELVENASYHLNEIKWMDMSTRENTAHLLASMHLSIREQDEGKSDFINNLSYTKFVEKFKYLIETKYSFIESSHKNVCRLLEHIQRQHRVAKKLMLQMEQEKMVLEERIKSADKMLLQIGQDMTMTEQQLKVHKSQTRKTVQLKRILPEYQTAHERNIYKTIAIVSNTKKLVQTMNMQSLQELRNLQKPSQKVEDILAVIIMILKTPTADVTWQKGAKRQMANLDRFLEELQNFDQNTNMNENTLKILEDMMKKIDKYDKKEDQSYADSLNTLLKWIRGVVRYHVIMNKRVRPLQIKCEEIEHEVKEADQKLSALSKKSKALQDRLTDLAQNFEEATVDKKEQEEKVVKMQQQLNTASELNKILSREYERNLQVYESLQQRIFSLPGACAFSAGFLVYLGAFQFPFRRLMLTMHWIKCLRDRGLPLVLDYISNLRGRIVAWQMDGVSNMLMLSKNMQTTNENDWKVRHVSDQRDTEPLMTYQKDNNTSQESKLDSTDLRGKTNTIAPTDAMSIPVNDDDDAIISGLPNTQKDTKNGARSNQMSATSRASEKTNFSGIISGTEYKKFISALVCYIIGEREFSMWTRKNLTSLEIENGAIIHFATRHPSIIYDPYSLANKSLSLSPSDFILNMHESSNSESTIGIEKAFQTGNSILLTNCSHIDSSILPLVQYKNAMSEIQYNDDSRLILFSNRRLFCDKSFKIYISTTRPFMSFTTNTLCLTTPVNYRPSIENLVDQFQASLYELLFQSEFEIKNYLLDKIRECDDKLTQIDNLLKEKWQNDGFQDEEVVITKMALERKYKIGEVLEYCNECMNFLDDLYKVILPLSLKSGLLLTLAQKLNQLSKNYEFSADIFKDIFQSFVSMIKPMQVEIDIKSRLPSSDENKKNIDAKLGEIDSQLPKLPHIDTMKTHLNTYSNETIDTLVAHLTKSFIHKIIIYLHPEHRLYLLTLISFYEQIENGIDFTETELEFLVKGNYNTNLINVRLSDFGLSNETRTPKWIPKDNFDDLLALSLLQGDLDHFVLALLSNEKEWKEWYENPLKCKMPAIEMETENTNKIELVELSKFRQLLVYRVLRPDVYVIKLHEFVREHFSLEFEYEWKKTVKESGTRIIVINGREDATLNSVYDMHKRLFTIAESFAEKMIVFNCNNLNANELNAEASKIKKGLLILKNIHLASDDLFYCIVQLCLSICDDDKIKWRLVLTKSFEFILPLKINLSSLQISHDILETMKCKGDVHNLAKVNTFYVNTNEAIHKNIVYTLSLLNGHEFKEMLEKTTEIQNTFIYLGCIVQALLMTRQVFGALKKSIPWSSSTLIQYVEVIKQAGLTATDNISSYLIKEVYATFMDDDYDLDYIKFLINSLTQSISSRNICINDVTLPFPGTELKPQEFKDWFMQQADIVPIDHKILQLHESTIMLHNTLKSEEFSEKLLRLWDNLTDEIGQTNTIKPDHLQFSIRTCIEKLPPLLKLLETQEHDDHFSLALYEECLAFNNYISMIQTHLREIEKYVLVDTNLFPIEWKQMALVLQLQRIPNEWILHDTQWPCVHSLKSWINYQNFRYNQLCGFVQKKFRNIHTLNLSSFEQPKLLLDALLQSKCARNMWKLSEAELSFELIMPTPSNDSLIIHGIALVGGVYEENSIDYSESFVNNFPALHVTARLKSQIPRDGLKLRLFTNKYRQCHVLDLEQVEIKCQMKFMPYLVLDVGYEEKYSRRQHKIVISNLDSLSQSQSQSQLPTADTQTTQKLDTMRTQRLSQIREASVERLPTPESQLSYKPLTPTVKNLPNDLKLLQRSINLLK